MNFLGKQWVFSNSFANGSLPSIKLLYSTPLALKVDPTIHLSRVGKDITNSSVTQSLHQFSAYKQPSRTIYSHHLTIQRTHKQQHPTRPTQCRTSRRRSKRRSPLHHANPLTPPPQAPHPPPHHPLPLPAPHPQAPTPRPPRRRTRRAWT